MKKLLILFLLFLSMVMGCFWGSDEDSSDDNAINANFKDQYEDNNSSSSATDINSFSGLLVKDVNFHNGDDVDWYKLYFQDTVSTASTLTINFIRKSDNMCNIDVTVYRANATTIVESFLGNETETIGLYEYSQRAMLYYFPDNYDDYCYIKVRSNLYGIENVGDGNPSGPEYPFYYELDIDRYE